MPEPITRVKENIYSARGTPILLWAFHDRLIAPARVTWKIDAYSRVDGLYRRLNYTPAQPPVSDWGKAPDLSEVIAELKRNY